MKDLLARSRERADLLPILKEGQARYGYLPPQFLEGIASALHLSVSEVYGVASFYSFLSTRPLGRNAIWVCKCLPCQLKDGPALLGAMEDELGIGLGQITPDGRFSLHLTNCIGACDQAPAIMVNQDRHGKVDPKGVKDLLARYR